MRWFLSNGRDDGEVVVCAVVSCRKVVVCVAVDVAGLVVYKVVVVGLVIV